MKRKWTPPELAELWGIAPDKVLRWIRSGELRAIDASTRCGRRPRYLIDADDIADFERRRRVVPDERPAPRPPRNTVPEYV
jgi:predicted site-specific integrase-resolvase